MTQISGFDITVLREEAKTRWLKPSEVYYILQNHKKYPITSEPRQQPPSGSLLLYNRRVNRYFRKDGYSWRKKKDGRAVGEAHEKLKVGNVDALSCYYAHGEQNPCFQRRCFWMLDPAHEHIVLVQYLEVTNARYVSASLSNLPTESSSALVNPCSIYETQYHSSTPGVTEPSESYRSYSTLTSIGEVSSFPAIEGFEKDDGNAMTSPELGQASSEGAIEVCRGDNSSAVDKSGLSMALRKLAEQLSLDDYDDYIYLEQRQPSDSIQNVEVAGWQDNHKNTRSTKVSGGNRAKQIQAQETHNGLQKRISWKDMQKSGSGSPASSSYQSDIHYQQNGEYQPSSGHLNDDGLHLQLSETRRFLLGSEDFTESPSFNFILSAGENDGRLRKYPSPDWIGTTPLTVENDAYSAQFSDMLFGQSQFDPFVGVDTSLTLAQKQRFSIREISPEWAFSYESTKVIIIGDFLCDPLDSHWAAMFGDTEVPVEIIQQGVFRCHTPLHSAGKLTLCITGGNRESCSEVRDFEFHAKPPAANFIDPMPSSNAVKTSEELLFLAKFARMLLCENDSSVVSEAVDPQAGQCAKLMMNDEHWQQLIDKLEMGCQKPLSTIEWIMEEVLKNKLQQWLSVKCQGYEGAECLLSKQEQCIIHFSSALGYEWALSLILNAGVGINFRDANGWTALHWAAYFGRERMVAALLAAGASATAVTDPTAQDPVGKTAAFVASERGHGGLAGYLSEVALTSHLASLTIEESEISRGSAAVEAERAVESVSQRSAQLHGGTEDELSLKDSLAAVRNAAQAAARIQNAFRAYSFRKREQKASQLKDEYGMTQEDIDELAAASRVHNQNSDKAAVSIQKKYRGWRGRKNFLKMRRNAVKIQAHVRGHLERKKYRIVSTVSVLEKVILRWRRKGAGLRGFRVEQPAMKEEEDDDDEESDDNDEVIKVFRRQKVDESVKEAVSRVLSMVDSPDARQQYRRMLERFREATAELGASDEATSRLLNDFDLVETDPFLY